MDIPKAPNISNVDMGVKSNFKMQIEANNGCHCPDSLEDFQKSKIIDTITLDSNTRIDSLIKYDNGNLDLCPKKGVLISAGETQDRANFVKLVFDPETKKPISQHEELKLFPNKIYNKSTTNWGPDGKIDNMKLTSNFQDGSKQEIILNYDRANGVINYEQTYEPPTVENAPPHCCHQNCPNQES